MSINPSSLVASDSLATAQELWDVSTIFRHNFVEKIKINTSWSTDIAEARSVSEKRVGLVSKPYRTMTFNLMAYTPAGNLLLDRALARLGTARSVWPVYPDASAISATGEVGGHPVISCDTSYRRWATGGRVFLAELSSEDETFGNVALRTIETLAEGSITLPDTETLPDWLSAAITRNRAFAFPAMECDPLLQSETELITDTVQKCELTLVESPGRSALPAVQTLNTVPSGMSSYLGLPVVEFGGDWSNNSLGRRRAGTSNELGRGRVTELLGERPQMVAATTASNYTREAIWRQLQLFDSRCGRLFPFWLLRPDTQLQLHSTTTISGTTVGFKTIGQVIDWIYFSHVLIQKKDGTQYIRAIQSVTRLAEYDQVTLDASIPSTNVSDIEKVRFVALCRFDDDEIEEEWTTDLWMSSELTAIELLQEKEVEIITV